MIVVRLLERRDESWCGLDAGCWFDPGCSWRHCRCGWWRSRRAGCGGDGNALGSCRSSRCGSRGWNCLRGRRLRLLGLRLFGLRSCLSGCHWFRLLQRRFVSGLLRKFLLRNRRSWFCETCGLRSIGQCGSLSLSLGSGLRGLHASDCRLVRSRGVPGACRIRRCGLRFVLLAHEASLSCLPENHQHLVTKGRLIG